MRTAREPIVRGSVKDIYEVDSEEIEFVFSDRISVFDKLVPVEIPHKGEVLARTAAFWFEVTNSLRVKTHFVEMTSPRSLKVRRVAVIRDYDQITSQTRGFLIPIEFVSRYYVAGTLYDRIRAGVIKPEVLGFPSDHVPAYGEKLPRPFFETGTKLEPVDVFIPPEQAMAMSSITQGQLQEIWSIVHRLDQEIQSVLDSHGRLIHPDGKKEFAIDSDGSLMLVDTFGTPDEDRFWDAEAYTEGRCVELSKEYVRQYYRSTGYKDTLYQAREAGKPEPPMPPLPQEEVRNASEIYVALYERITGQTF
ncbi:MAG: phosphoribosylaminoimidazolesuccinocarboxamide synthase [Chloroflexi bacterium]|nr:phosphoribosylaminoimidazolesuccinocarboxamide synthase [Chloroflexota bacterium]